MESRKCKRKLKNGIWHLEIKKMVFDIWTNPEESWKKGKNSSFKIFRNYCIQDISGALKNEGKNSRFKIFKNNCIQYISGVLKNEGKNSRFKIFRNYSIQDILWLTDRQTDRQLIHFSVALSKAKLLLPKEALNKIKNKLQIILLFK